jgi:outer membrane biosynthesis protein TonB
MDVAKHFRLTHDPFKAGAEREFAVSDNAVLNHEEARRFIATRIGVAGGTDLFSPAALDIIATASRGRPAALRLLAGNAMFHAAFDGARRVEEVHARQAAATQDIWRDIPAPGPAPPAVAMAAAPVAPVSAPPPAPEPAPAAAAPLIIAPAEFARPRAVEPADDDLPPPRDGWWRNVPPLARLAMVVGLLILSLPVIGYIVGEVKDERPAPDSNYLPEDSELAAADAEAPIDAAPELPPAAAPPAPAPVPVEPAEAGPPVDLTAQTDPSEPPVDVPPQPPVAAGAGETVPLPAPSEATVPEAPVEAAPVPEPEPGLAEPAGVAATPRVFVHYSSSQSGGADAAAVVAQSLREQGFTVVDIRAVPMSIETASVRYFYSADRANAEALHDALGAVLRPRGFSAGDLKSMTDYADLPRRGTLEVWVPAG